MTLTNRCKKLLAFVMISAFVLTGLFIPKPAVAAEGDAPSVKVLGATIRLDSSRNDNDGTQSLRIGIQVDNANKASACAITLTVGSKSYTVGTENAPDKDLTQNNVHSKDMDNKSIVYAVVLTGIPADSFYANIGIAGQVWDFDDTGYASDTVYKNVVGVVSTIQNKYPDLNITLGADGSLYKNNGAEKLTSSDINGYSNDPDEDEQENIDYYKLCEFTFDGEDPLSPKIGKATAPNGYSTVDRNGGKALSLDGSSQYLDVTKSDGSSLLAGLDEFTISFDIVTHRTDTNWGFYTAPNRNAQGSPENYLGSIFNGGGNGNLTIERYYQGRGSALSSTVNGSALGAYSAWHHIDVVVRERGTIVLRDGYFGAASESASKISSMLGSNPIFLIGRANWGNGEFCQGEIDNFTVYKGVPADVADIITTNAYNGISIPFANNITEDITLSDYYQGADITWTSSDTSVVSDSGQITVGDEDQEATMTATISCGEYAEPITKDIDITVKTDSVEGILCKFTFDGSDAIAGTVGKATAPSGYSTIDRNGGKALSLNGSSQYLSITNEDGSSLLAGKDEFTISFDINTRRTSSNNWGFYAAPNSNSQSYNNENYLGALFTDSTNDRNISVERYFGGRGSANSSSVNAAGAYNSWHHYDVVVRGNSTTILRDGAYAADKASASTITAMLGNNPILYIGRANWGSGEYGQIYLDNFIVYESVPESVADILLDNAENHVNIPGADRVDDDLILLTYYGGTDISWSSSNTNVITDAGVVTVGDEPIELTMTATISCGNSSRTKVFDVTVIEEPFDNYLVASYSFEDNLKNSCDASGNDTAQPKNSQIASNYTGTINYTNGVSGRAIQMNNYGLKLNKNNLGTDFTVSMWLKPDGTFAENETMLFLGHNSPERWIGVSGSANNRNSVKIWGKGGVLSTWTTLFSPTINSGAWHHLVLAGKDGILTAYYDGTKLGDSLQGNNPLDGSDQDIYLGLNFWDKIFTGAIDEVKIYSKAAKQSFVTEEFSRY